MDICEKYRVHWVYTLFKGGIYIFGGYLYRDMVSKRQMCKILKGGYIVVRNSKKRELSRAPLETGFFSIKCDEELYGNYADADCLEFWTADRRLVFSTSLQNS